MTAAAHPGSGDAVEVAGRAGLAARGLVYLVLAVLAALVAAGRGETEADTTGALAAIGDQPFGRVLLWALAACLAGYALWRVAEAVTGRTSTDHDAGAGERALSAGRAVLYLGLAGTALRLTSGTASGGGEQQQSWTATVLGWPAGALLVGAAGLALLAVAAVQVHTGVTASFLERLDVTGRSERTVRRIGTVGHVGRGVAFGLVGLFVVRAALTEDASRSQGLDGALSEVAARTYGTVLLLLLAGSLLAFGVYSLCEARWRRIQA